MSDLYKTMEERVSYGIGRQMGDQLASNAIPSLSIDAVLAGLASAINQEESVVSDADMQAAFIEMQARLQKTEAENAKIMAAGGIAFLKENAKRDGVNVTATGLQYEIITEGTGEKPTLNSTVKTHYHGTLIDGTVFDSSVQRNQPAEFPVSGVISGWTEALQMMPVGSKWRLYVPHDLAYGSRGAGAAIAPYTTLVFEVELLDIIA